MHRLRTLGGLLLEGPDGPASGALTQRRRLALLSLLAASDGGISRDRIIGLLWPESEEDKARHALSQLVHSLRRDLGDAAIVGSATTLRLNGGIVSSDVEDFAAAIERGDLERAVELYRGPFLDGFYLNGCPDFERWTDERRDALAHDVERAIETLARNASDASTAVTWWRRLGAMRRLDSRVALELMRAMARAGDRASAMEHASVHTALLRSELDHAPPQELTAFAESLRAAPSPVAPTKATQTPVSPTVAGAAATSTDRRHPRWRSRAGLIVMSAVALGGVALTIAFRGGPTSPARSVIIADVENTTGDRAFDRTVPVALAAVLRQSPRVRILSPDGIDRALVRMRRPRADSLLDERLAREIAQRDAVEIVAVPAINKAESAFEISAKLVEAPTGAVLAFVTERAATRADALDALDRLGRRIRRELGESRWSVRSTVPLPRVTTTSFDALEKFATGERAFREARWDDAERSWSDAVTLDSTFATAHANLGMFAFFNNRPTEGVEHYERALRHLSGLPEREQVFVRAASKRGRGDFEGSARLLAAYLAEHPDDIVARGQVGYDYMRLHKSAEAVAAYRRFLAVDSLNYHAWINMATAESHSGHQDAALRAYQKAYSIAPALLTANDNVNLEYAGAFVAAGQLDSARKTVELLAKHPEPYRHARGLRSLAFLESFRGQYTEAARVFAEAATVLRSTGWSNAATAELRNRLLVATALTELGRTREAAGHLDTAFAIVTHIDAEARFIYWTGKALARAGDVSRAATLATIAEKNVRKDSPPDVAALDALRGEILLARGQSKEANVRFDTAWRSDSTSEHVLESRAFGLASAGEYDRAAALYQRMASEQVFGSEGQHLWRMAPYWLARVYERSGKVVDARQQYERFIASWPAADPELRSVIDARNRQTRLRGG